MTNVISLPARTASQTAAQTAFATTTPVQGNRDPIQLHAEAHNALAMAVHYLTQPSANVPGAARKAVQALAALRRLDVTTTAMSAA